MKNLKRRFFSKFILIVAYVCLFLGTSFAQGGFHVGAGNIAAAEYQHVSPAAGNEHMVFPALVEAVAVAVGITYAAGYALGTLARHVWDSFIVIRATRTAVPRLSANYDPMNFSKFDNV